MQVGVIRSLLSQCKRLRKVCGRKSMKKRYVGGKVLKFKQKKVGVKIIKNQTKEKTSNMEIEK